MTDKQVGELWAWYVNGKFPETLGQDILTWDFTKPLILKLIEDRYIHFLGMYEGRHQEREEVRQRCLDIALRDFGIDYAEYLKAKESNP